MNSEHVTSHDTARHLFWRLALHFVCLKLKWILVDIFSHIEDR